MSNFKRRYVEVTLAVVILLILTLSGGYVFGDDKPVKPLVDFMFTPPNSIYADYGFSDKTFKFFNFIKLREVWQAQDIQIAALRAEIDELKKLVAELKESQAIIPYKTYDIDDHSIVLDPNEVCVLGCSHHEVTGWGPKNEVAK